MIELLNLTEEGLNANTAVELRKAGAELGIKGAAKGRKADLIAAIMVLVNEAKAAAKPVETPKGKCTDCGRKEGFRGSQLCDECREYAEWENTHSDHGHDDGKGEYAEQCPVCRPELDPRTARKTGRSRAGMVILAKGTEVHKSNLFAKEAEAKGWTVTTMSETYELPEGTTGEGTRWFATATRGEESISLAWDGRAYDYHASSAVLAGKPRKIRNLKEALRLI